MIDHSYDWEVWNFPLVAFDITEAERVDEARATDLVGGGDGYLWNPHAAGWVRIAMTYWLVSDDVSADAMRHHADERDIASYAVPLHYVLELDANDFVLGGEWIESPAIGGVDSRELHPDFLWIAVDHQGPGENPTTPAAKATTRTSRTSASRSCWSARTTRPPAPHRRSTSRWFPSKRPQVVDATPVERHG